MNDAAEAISRVRDALAGTEQRQSQALTAAEVERNRTELFERQRVQASQEMERLAADQEQARGEIEELRAALLQLDGDIVEQDAQWQQADAEAKALAIVTWCIVIVLIHRQGWASGESDMAIPEDKRSEEPEPLDLWQTTKGLAVAIVLFIAFLYAPWPRELMALAGAGLLLCRRRLHSRHMLGLVDWQILILFIGLFVVNHAVQRTGLLTQVVEALASAGFDLRDSWPLFVTSFALSNIVSNVPAVMLLLPTTAGEYAGTLLALSSTLAGNLLIVGSIANIIVVNESARKGVMIGWRDRAAFGIPVTLATLAITVAYL